MRSREAGSRQHWDMSTADLSAGSRSRMTSVNAACAPLLHRSAPSSSANDPDVSSMTTSGRLSSGAAAEGPKDVDVDRGSAMGMPGINGRRDHRDHHQQDKIATVARVDHHWQTSSVLSFLALSLTRTSPDQQCCSRGERRN